MFLSPRRKAASNTQGDDERIYCKNIRGDLLGLDSKHDGRFWVFADAKLCQWVENFGSLP